MIHRLSAHDTSATHTYTLLLLILPLAPTPFYVPRLFRLSTCIPSLVAIASLLATAYTLYFLPLPPTEMEAIHDHSTLSLRPSPRNSAWEKPSEKPGRRPVPFVSPEVAELLAGYIVTVNRAMCGFLALYEVWLGGEWIQGLMIGGGFLPGVICMVILYARTELRIIDVEQLRRWQDKGDAVDADERYKGIYSAGTR